MTYDRVIDDDGVARYYQDVGDGPALVFLHGFSGNHLSWWRQIPTFRDDYRCIVPDQRMFGRSEDAPNGPGAAAFVDDLVGLFEHLDVERAALVGHSMSGWPASAFTTRYPGRVSALALSGTPGGLISPDRHEELQETGADGLPSVDPLGDAEAFLSESIGELNRDAPEEFSEIRPTLDDFEIDAVRIRESDVPALLIAGEADPFMPKPAIRAVADELGDPSTEIVPGAAHSANFERPEEFNRRLRSFLEEAV